MLMTYNLNDLKKGQEKNRQPGLFFLSQNKLGLLVWGKVKAASLLHCKAYICFQETPPTKRTSSY